MASIGEAAPQTPPHASTEPSPPAQPPAASPATSPEPTPIARSRAGGWVGSVLLRIWRARGFFGGLAAMVLAFLGQRTLIDQGDVQVAQRYYVAAILLLILSLLHPTFSVFTRLRRRQPAPGSSAGSNSRESATLLSGAPDSAEPPAGDQPLSSVNGASAPSNGREHADPSNVDTSKEWEVIAPLPVRRRAATTSVALHTQQSTSTGPITRPLMAADSPVLPSPDTTPDAIGVAPAPASQRVPFLRRLWPFGARSKGWARPGILSRYVALRTRLGWRLTLPLFLLTVIASLGTFLMLRADLSDSRAGWLWFVSLVLLFVTFAGAPRWPIRLDGMLDGPEEGFFAKGIPFPSARVEALMVGAMLVLGLVLRLWNLEYFPGIFGDEGERGMDARAIVEGRPTLIWGTGWWAVPNLYFYWIAWSLRIFGDNMVGDRMPSVIAGMVAIWAIYRIGRLLWGPRAGLIAGTLLAVSPLWLQYSREAGESTPTVMCWALGFLFLFKALRSRRWLDWALSGVAFGFSLYFYASGKMVVPLVGLIALYLLVRYRWEGFKRYAPGYLLLLFGFFLTFMPYALYLSADNFEFFFSRARETSIFTPAHQPNVFARHGVIYDSAMAGLSTTEALLKYPAAWAQVIFHQARLATEVLYKIGDSAFFYTIRDHNGTLLTPVLACLAVLGLVYAHWKAWDSRYGLNLLWFWAGMAGIIFTIDAPNVQRLVGAWPVLFLFPAAVIDRVLASAWPLNISFARKWLTLPVIGFLLFATVEGVREYFVIYEAQCSFCTATVQARHVQTFGQEYKGYQMGVGPYSTYFTYGSTRFAAKGIEGEDLNVPMESFPIINNNNKGLAFIVFPFNGHYMPLVNLFYPGGVQEEIRGNDGSFQFYSYKVSRDKLSHIQTSFAEYRNDGGEVFRRFEPNMGTSRPSGEVAWSPPPGVGYPMRATWEGGVVAPMFGQYTFFLQGETDAQLLLDGESVLDGANPEARQVTRVLARGVHELKVTGTLRDPNSRVDFRWSGGVGTPLPVASNYLYSGPTGGLLGTLGYDSYQPVDAPDPFQNQDPFRYHVDPFLGIRDAGAATASFGSRPFYLRWQGTLMVPQTGDYSFAVESNGPHMVKIDDKIVINTAGPLTAPNPLPLEQGPHEVDIRYTWQGQPGGMFEWFWAPPGAERALVPPSVLRPLKRSWMPEEVIAPSAVPNVAPPPPPAEPIKPDAVLGRDAGLREARGIGVDPAGNIFIADNGNHRVVSLSPLGQVIGTWGTSTETSGEGKINLLGDLAVGPDGHVFTIDSNNGDVHDFNPDGTVARYMPGLASASGGIDVGPDGNIYIANTIGSQILVVSRDGSIIGNWLGGPQGTLTRFEQPIDVTFSPEGTAYVVDMRGRIAELDGNGNVAREWPVQIGLGRGGSHLIYWKGKVVMTNPDQGKLAVLDPSTGDVQYVGEAGSGESQMHIPVGVAVGPGDKLYVMDSGNNRVLVFAELPLR